ncbi:MAG: NEW3 domain-containing protein, partial [Candidatus Thermoplasmatota archaeon]|nr:NEW3 domain-containing protein [Candidatus Thermoplasmatota archaeon]
MAGGTIMRQSVLTLTAALLLAGAALAGTQGDPEIQDGSGDVNAQYLVDPGSMAPEERPEALQDLSDEQLAAVRTSADLVAAWITNEGPDQFTIKVQVADLYDHENISSPLVEITPHFRIDGGTPYHAPVTLSLPVEGGSVQTHGELYQGSTFLGDLSSQADNESDTVTLRIAKSLVGDPGFGNQLTHFYVTSHVAEETVVLDYAPEQNPAAPTEITVGENDLGPLANYGQLYDFGAYEGAVQAAITASATPSSLTFQQGDQGKASIMVRNDAPAEDTVDLMVGNRPAGWDVRISPSQLTIQPGQAQLATVTVSPPSSASGQEILTIRLTTALGGDQQVPLSVQVQAPPPEPSQPTQPAPTQPSSPAP